MNHCRSIFLLIFLLTGVAGSSLHAAEQAGVGLTAELKDVLLPGPELRVKPDTGGRSPVVLRITATYPHGTAGFRYDFVWSALDAGPHNLSQYLERQDGSPAPDLPPVPVEAIALLPPGPPKTLPEFAAPVPALGGYRTMLIAGGVVWLAGLIGLLAWRRKKVVVSEDVLESAIPLEDRLRPLLEKARAGSLDAEGRARLDRLVLGFWRGRLGLTGLPMPEAMKQLRAHPEAGQLLRQVEEWIHSGKAAAQESAVAEDGLEEGER
jgi:hypothetical protein